MQTGLLMLDNERICNAGDRSNEEAKRDVAPLYVCSGCQHFHWGDESLDTASPSD
jgi:hypothetical protein